MYQLTCDLETGRFERLMIRGMTHDRIQEYHWKICSKPHLVTLNGVCGGGGFTRKQQQEHVTLVYLDIKEVLTTVFDVP